ncbi:hypothetical protein A4D02_20930 [Niastella koreensis]|uniref:RagB/SusD domain-containing protein n=3 Tax=Niastella koreensis TaxID=354356 RepID=G8TMX5_NIAKG|nr:hypothetical protein Niako_0237 [Niastella koreensis GR20-10]OQP54211.1 hypothetical protein A4D02_20930 [Niastella koreensis]
MVWLFFLSVVVTGSSCKKYLDKKPIQNLIVPSSLSDLQALLDNQNGNSLAPGITEFVADNYYLTTAAWSPLNIDLRKNYTWDNDARITNVNSVWSNPYTAIYNANFVLDYLPKITKNDYDAGTYNNIKGMALFYRAYMFHQLAQLFCAPYSTSTAGSPGIVLRTTAETDAPINRSTVQQTYDQIISDLKTAADLLLTSQTFTTRPGKAAAYGELARVYLSMRDYANAEVYANNALTVNNTLLDYNALTPVGNPVLPANPINNPEILFISRTDIPGVYSASHEAIVDTTLYRSYNANDLRKTVFFGSNGNNNYWKGSYYTFGGTDYSIFDGLATDEIYLIRAECRARKGDANAAMDDLNTLLRNRWKTGAFTNLVAIDANDALTQVLNERRKELAFRGLRWSDLRRLNLEGANISLTRVVNGTTYTLPANDLRWTLLIPDLEINRSGIAQNPR